MSDLTDALAAVAAMDAADRDLAAGLAARCDTAEQLRLDRACRQADLRATEACIAAVRSIQGGGFVLVPREPTEAMLQAAYTAQETFLDRLGQHLDEQAAGDGPDLCALQYAAMLAAATPPTKDQP